jgi:hypothetical protein
VNVTVAETARLIRADAEADSYKVDKTPFTAQGVGPLFGAILAMIAALAECVEELAEAKA